MNAMRGGFVFTLLLNPADGAVCERFVSLLDIYPTMAELCGLEPPGYLDGRSLVPLLKNPTTERESTAVTGLTSKGGPWRRYISIRDGTGRYTHYIDGQEEFYDTTKDPLAFARTPFVRRRLCSAHHLSCLAPFASVDYRSRRSRKPAG